MRLRRVVQLAAGLAMALSSALPGRAADDGFYSAAQAARGETLYEQYCMTCHGAKLQGNPAAPLAGPVFQGRWADGQHTLDDLFYIVRTQMPYSAPGSLAKQQYADVIAYVLKMNGYEPGATELMPIASTLKKITLQPR